MSKLELYSPASESDAIQLHAGARAPVDSPAQRRIRGADNLHEFFDAGRRL